MYAIGYTVARLVFKESSPDSEDSWLAAAATLCLFVAIAIAIRVLYLVGELVDSAVRCNSIS